jgi:hypothetical protein
LLAADRMCEKLLRKEQRMMRELRRRRVSPQGV